MFCSLLTWAVSTTKAYYKVWGITVSILQIYPVANWFYCRLAIRKSYIVGWTDSCEKSSLCRTSILTINTLILDNYTDQEWLIVTLICDVTTIYLWLNSTIYLWSMVHSTIFLWCTFTQWLIVPCIYGLIKPLYCLYYLKSMGPMPLQQRRARRARRRVRLDQQHTLQLSSDLSMGSNRCGFLWKLSLGTII